MTKHKNGAVDSSQTIKAGCGIRYDPEVLGEESGFDFSAAEELKPDPIGEEANGEKSNERKAKEQQTAQQSCSSESK